MKYEDARWDHVYPDHNQKIAKLKLEIIALKEEIEKLWDSMSHRMDDPDSYD